MKPSHIKRHALRRETYMPLKIKRILMDHDLRQAQLCASVKQFNGAAISKTAMTELYLKGMWPKRTPPESIKRQSIAWLIEQGVPEAEARTAFELDEEEQANGSCKRGRPTTRSEAPPAEEPETPDFLEPCMLTPEAKRHFRLFADPFSVDIGSHDDVFFGTDHLYAAEALHEAVRNNRFFALVGESGSGKTTLVDDFRDRIRREQLPVKILTPMVADKANMSGSAILEAIIRDLDPDTTLRSSNEARSRQANQMLAERTEEGGSTVLLFEEAHDMHTNVLKLLKRFHEMKVGFRRTLSIVLIAQPELLLKLAGAGSAVREVANRLEIAKLLPLDDDMAAYVAKKLERCNRAAADIFTSDAWDAARERLTGLDAKRGERVSYAYPLLVNNLLTAAMNEAAALGAAKVDAAIVKGVQGVRK